MDYKQLELFGMANKKMRWLTQRQDVLSQNVANADTPDYVPRDLKALDFKKTLQQQFHRLSPRAASTGASLPGTLPVDPKFRSPEEDVVYEKSPNGNAVVLEEQLIKVTETNIEYQTVTDLYRKYGQMVKTALGRGGGR